MERRYQREEPPRGLEIDRHLILQTFDQKLRATIMDTTPGHIDRLDLGGVLLVAQRAEIAFADREIILDRPPEAGEPKLDRFQQGSGGVGDVDRQTPFLDA